MLARFELCGKKGVVCSTVLRCECERFFVTNTNGHVDRSAFTT